MQQVKMKPFCARSSAPRAAAVNPKTNPLVPAGCQTSLVALTAALLVTLHPAAPAHAVEDADNPYIQELVRRSETNREQRKKEVLEHYTSKVFADYFDFAGPVSPELQAEIDAWKKQHLDKPVRRFAPPE